MIDLSHLTEEEQEAIMMVLKRDAELKKAEEERVRNLEKILPSSSQPEVKLKYLTGEWFYEAKSRRHNDKIHGSEIILAAMKQRKTGSLDGSLRMDRPKISSRRGSDTVAPPKPVRCLEASPPQDRNNAEKENRYSGVRSPRVPRHNPFNRASLIVVEPPVNNQDMSISRGQNLQDTEPISALKNHSAGDSGHTSGGSITSDGSSVGFRPVPKKRTLLTRCSTNQLGSETQLKHAEVVPAPRRRLQQGSGESSSQSCLKIQDESALNKSAQAPKAAGGNSQQPPCDASKTSSETFRPSRTGSNVTAEWREDPDDQNQHMDIFNLSSSKVQVEESSSSVGTSARQEALSLPQSIMDPPTTYDLNFIDKSDQQKHKSSKTGFFKLSTPTTSPTGEDGEAIAKVLDWFDRSTDSSDWLESEENPKAAESFDRPAADSKSRAEDSCSGGVSERKLEKAKTRGHRKGSRELAETQENVRREHTDESGDESRPLKISHLKSFWEKSNPGPKILISKSVTPGEKGLNPAHISQENYSDLSSVPERYSGMGMHNKYSPRIIDEKEHQLVNRQVISTVNSHQQEEHLMIHSTQINSNDSDHLNSQHTPEIIHRKPLDVETLNTARQSSSDRTIMDHKNVSLFKPKLQSDSDSESKESLLLSDTRSVPQLDPETRVRTESEMLVLSKNIPYMDYKQGGSEEQVRQPIPRSSSEDKSIHSASPKRKDDASNKDRTHSSHLNRQALHHQESTAEKIKQLKSFWEQELNKPTFYSGKPRALGDGRVAQGASQARLNKRFTKSEFDLTSVGNESGSDNEGGVRTHSNFTVVPLNQRLDKMPPNLGTSRAQFNTLREFWDEASSDSRGLLVNEKPKSPRRKEPLRSQLSSQELKGADLEIYHSSPAVEKSKGVVTKSHESPQNQSKSPHNRRNNSKNNVAGYIPAETGQPKQTKRSSKDSNREEKFTKPQSSLGKEIRSPKTRKDSFGVSSSRGNSLRRATSMFALAIDDEKAPNLLRMEVNPICSQSRKPRQIPEKGPLTRRTSNEPETAAPLARAFVPTDYRHYLGMMEPASVHTTLAPVVKDEGSEVKPGYELDLSGPVRASTPVSSEERYNRKSNKTNQRPSLANYSESDTGQDSSISSTSETWSSSRNTLNRANAVGDQNPVWEALRRAAARPKNLTKSLEDITATISPRQERRPDQIADLRRSSNAAVIQSPSSSSFADPDHLKKMSKSVPSFLQKELSGSVITMYSGDFVEVQGNIQFSINYVQRLREFHIFVAECRNLAAVESKRSRSDPYVKSYLVPDKASLGKRKTSVKKKTLNPKFNEILRYRVRMEYLRTQTLVLSVWHHDTFGRNSFLGEVDVDLSKWDFGHTQMNYLALKARTLPSIAPLNGGRGEMRLAIRFLPQITHSEGLTKDVASTGEIHIWVKECKNLPLIRATIDPYVKCFVLPDTSRKSRQKTRVLRRTVEPVFNHTMVYDGISEADLSDACVELTVWDRDRLASNLLGGLRLGAGTGKSYGALVEWMDSGPYEVALWERMIASPNEWVEDVLPLRMLNSAKTAFK
ncbi:synaptotagmin-like protein 2 isoform X2 [Nothobranchius furzeri]|uniref:synaptotagmin-like protein 2 isoform X2 n=1 Tax=Nothobranchius furzeri TaxID=105023 RepID=UPI00077D2584|nr:synaptotagmin-like protein 2 isoform X2 [Nothobranchius furzeri]